LKKTFLFIPSYLNACGECIRGELSRLRDGGFTTPGVVENLLASHRGELRHEDAARGGDPVVEKWSRRGVMA
jgi:hypothetical protein